MIFLDIWQHLSYQFLSCALCTLCKNNSFRTSFVFSASITNNNYLPQNRSKLDFSLVCCVIKKMSHSVKTSPFLPECKVFNYLMKHFSLVLLFYFRLSWDVVVCWRSKFWNGKIINDYKFSHSVGSFFLGQTDERTGNWMDERTDEWTDGRTDRRTNGRTKGWTNGQTNGRTNVRTNGRTNEWLMVNKSPNLALHKSFIPHA